MKIYYRPRFLRAFRRLDSQIQKRTKKRIILFEHNPFDAKLSTHTLHGKLKGFWSFSVDQRYRILFQFLDKKKEGVVFLDIGTHALYR